MASIDHPTASAARGWLPGALTILGLGLFAWAFLQAQETWEVLALLVLAVLAVPLGGVLGVNARIQAAWNGHETLLNSGVVAAVVVLIFALSGENFPLLMLTTTLVYFTASLGLNVQFGLAGIVNFAGAAFFGAGAYTAAVLGAIGWFPQLVTLVCGGLVAALLSLVLLAPILRTRGHYSAIVTIAFGVLFTTFLQVNQILGGPQGLMVASMKLPGWDFNDAPTLIGADASFYVSYALFAALMATLIFWVVRRLERSWLGLHMDVVRLDETAAACFGVSVRRTKILAFLAGNLILGIAGAFYGMLISFIAPQSFTFSDSLLMVSIVLLGGMGSLWGGALATVIVVLLPEKLQIIQEYRFLLFSVLVILALLFRPQGLLPRLVRDLRAATGGRR